MLFGYLMIWRIGFNIYVFGTTTFNWESRTTFHHLYNCFCRGNEDEWFLHENTKKEMSTLAKRPQQPQDYNHHQDGLLLDVDEDLGGWVQKISLRIYESNSNLGRKIFFFSSVNLSLVSLVRKSEKMKGDQP